MAPEAVDGPGDGAAGVDSDTADIDGDTTDAGSDTADIDGDTTDAGNDTTDAGTGSPLVDRWIALDRGWQALLLGLGIVAVHAAGQAAGVF
ncbi:MAG: hypothetical protein R6U01_00950 [Halorubrum sp.]|uniref:hypothetical protein n=1 Tax=Halorubrum sp. TaxID=1879286 RepID=UPI0039705D53